MGDVLGRRACLLLTSTLVVIGAFGCTFAVNWQMITAFRILMGVGIGGEYPLSSSHTADSTSDSQHSGRNVSLVYALGKLGTALCPLVGYLLVSSALPASATWRLLFGVGGLISLLGLISRALTLRNAKSFEAAASRRKASGLTTLQIISKYWYPLIGTSLSWFLYDIIEYGLSQNDAKIFNIAEADPFCHELTHGYTVWVPECRGHFAHSILTIFFNNIPSVVVQVAVAYVVICTGMKYAQLIGFFGCGLALALLAVFYQDLHQESNLGWFDFVYIIQLCMQGFMGATTFAIPAQIFPSEARGLGHGISAGVGKLGAILGVSVIYEILQEARQHTVMPFVFAFCAGVSVLGIIVTSIFIPNFDGETLDVVEEARRRGDHAEASGLLFRGNGRRQSEKIKKASVDEQDACTNI